MYFKSLLYIFHRPHFVKRSKHGVFSGPFFPVVGRNTGKYKPEKTPYLGTFHASFKNLTETMNALIFAS